LTNNKPSGIIVVEREVRKMKERKTDRETLLEIFKRAGVNIVYEQDDYIEVEPETYGENVGFDFDSQGNFKKLL
jgi:hypothetical protein